MADLINSSSIRSFDQKQTTPPLSTTQQKSILNNDGVNRNTSSGSGFSLPNPGSARASPVTFLNENVQSPTQNTSPIPSNSSIRGYNVNSTNNNNNNNNYNNNNNKKYKEILPNPMIKQSSSSSLSTQTSTSISPPTTNSSTSYSSSSSSSSSSLIRAFPTLQQQKQIGASQSLDSITSLLNDYNDQQPDYYCKHCFRTYPPKMFVNKAAFNKHLTTCSNKKRKAGDEGFVPEYNSNNNLINNSNNNSNNNNNNTTTTTTTTTTSSSFNDFRKLNVYKNEDSSEYEYNNNNNSNINNNNNNNNYNNENNSKSKTTRDTMNINNLNNDSDSSQYRQPYSSNDHLVGFTQPNSSPPPSSPRGSTDLDQLQSSLRFALLDVIEDKIAEETELEYIRRDFKNIGNEIIIQDFKKEKEIQQLYQVINTELKETEERVNFDIVDRSKQEENQMKKMKEELLIQFNELESQLKKLIEKLPISSASSSTSTSSPSSLLESNLPIHQNDTHNNNNHHHHQDEVTKSEIKVASPLIKQEIRQSPKQLERNSPQNDKELTIDESNDSIDTTNIGSKSNNNKNNNSSNNNNSNQVIVKKDNKKLIDEDEENDDQPTISTSIIKNDDDKNDQMKLKITFSKKSSDLNLTSSDSSNPTVVSPMANDDAEIGRKEIIKKIEEIKKLMNEKIMNYSVALATQGREFDRVITIQSNNYEKLLSKKFHDMKKDLNENTDALSTSFDILDNILISQSLQHQQMQQHYKQQQQFQQQQQHQQHHNQQPFQPINLPPVYNNSSNFNSNNSMNQYSYNNYHHQQQQQNNQQNQKKTKLFP
ncbi:hypothetical protein ACTFIW_001899 [Dictyostelium discoideum]